MKTIGIKTLAEWTVLDDALWAKVRECEANALARTDPDDKAFWKRCAMTIQDVAVALAQGDVRIHTREIDTPDLRPATEPHEDMSRGLDCSR